MQSCIRDQCYGQCSWAVRARMQCSYGRSAICYASSSSCSTRRSCMLPERDRRTAAFILMQTAGNQKCSAYVLTSMRARLPYRRTRQPLYMCSCDNVGVACISCASLSEPTPLPAERSAEHPSASTASTELDVGSGNSAEPQCGRAQRHAPRHVCMVRARC